MKTSSLRLLLLSIAILSVSLKSNGQSWTDASLYASSAADELNRSLKDKNDNTYWLGVFEGPLKIGSETLKNEEGAKSTVLFKRKSNGELDWVAQMGIGKTSDAAAATLMYLNESGTEIMVTGFLSDNSTITFTNPKGSDFNAKSTSSDRRFDAYYGLDGELKKVNVYNTSLSRDLWEYDPNSSNVFQTQTISGDISLTKGPLDGSNIWATAFKGATEISDIHIANDGRIAVVGEFDNNLTIGDSTYNLTTENNIFVAVLDKDGKAMSSEHLQAGYGASERILLEGDQLFLVSFFDRFMTWRGDQKLFGDATAVAHFEIENTGSITLKSTQGLVSNPFSIEEVKYYGNHLVVAGSAGDRVLVTGGTADDFEYTNGSYDCVLAFYDATEMKVTNFLLGGGGESAQERFNALQILSDGTVLAGGWVSAPNSDIKFGKVELTGNDDKDMVIATAKLTHVGIDTDLQKAGPIAIYPNPVNNRFKIETSSPIEQIRVLDIQGQVVQIKYARQIDASALPSGLYILEAISDTKILRTQFIKN